MSRLVRGLSAIAALITLLIGVPYALVLFVGLPVPTAVPRLDEMRRSIEQTGIAEGTIIKLIAIVVWIAWLRLAIAVMVELAATASMRPVPQLRLLGSSQRIAGGLIAATLLMFGGIRPGMASASAAPRSPNAASVGVVANLPTRTTTPRSNVESRASVPIDPAVALPSSTATLTPPTTATWTVQRNDSFWRIAQATLGDGQRWHEVVAANIGREVAPGILFSAETEAIHPGWVLTVPGPPAVAATSAPAATIVLEVHRGDSLASIAEEVYGNSAEWPTVWEANQGRQFGDRMFDDPNLIMPGWQLQIPDDPVTHVKSAPDPTPTATEATAATEATVATAPAREPSVTGSARLVSPHDPRPIIACPEPSTASAYPPPAALKPPTPQVPPATPGVPSLPARPATTTQPAATTTATTSPRSEVDGIQRSALPLGLGAAGLLATGVLGLLTARRRTILRGSQAGDRLSALAQPLIRLERELRVVAEAERLARLDLVVRRAHQHLLEAGNGGRFLGALVHPDGEIELCLAPEAAAAAAPFHPGMDGRWVMSGEIALEAIGVESRFAAFPCPGLVQLGRFEDADVYLDLEAVGLLAIDGPSSVVTTSILRAIALSLCVSPFAEQAQLLTCGIDVPRLDGGITTTTVETADEAIDLAAELLTPILGSLRSGQTTAELRYRSAGEAWEPALVLMGAPAVDAGMRTSLPGLCSPAGRGLAVVTDATVGAADRLVAQEDGWLLTPLGLVIRPIGLSGADAELVALLVAEAAQTVERAVPMIRAVSDETSRALPYVEPDWALMVRILGPVDLVDRAGSPVAFERAKAQELVVWLVEHRGSATRRGARAALWDTEVQDATFANVVSDARRNMARLAAPVAGEEWIARSLDEQLAIHDRLVSDADLLVARVGHARGQVPREAVSTLRAGLELVREAPFTASTYLWPDAEGVTSQVMLVITEAATLMAEHCLNAGDLNGVFWATGKGLLAVPGHEELIALRMRAYGSSGDLAGVRAEWASYERVLHADRWSAGEPAPKLLELRRELLGTRLAA